MAAQQNYIFGLCDITYGEAALPVLGDKAVLTIEPEYIDINSYEIGGLVDKLVKTWKVSLDVVFEQETAEVMGLCIPLDAKEDSALGKSLRATGKELKIHPRSAGESEEFDVTIFKAVSTGSYERIYGLEQGYVKVTFNALVKDGAKPGVKGNFFRIGAASSLPASLAE